MAKLNPKDPQFGIPIAARIRKELAEHFNLEAQKQNTSFSKYISEYLENAAVIETQLYKEREIVKKTVGRFIIEITKGNKDDAKIFIEKYNQILKEEKSNF